jgi:general secretion pathway protein F
MIHYRCDVIDGQGVRQSLRREAASKAICVNELVSQGYTPLRLRSGKLTIAEILNRPIALGGTGGSAAQALFLRQLAILVSADLPVDRSVDLLRDQASGRRQKQVLAEMLRDIRGGRSLSDAIETAGGFPSWVVGVLRSADSGGDLGGALTSAADRMAAITATRRALLAALTYPAAVLVATIVALALILTLVVPQFEPIFEGSEDRLPALTQFVLLMAAYAGNWGAALLVTIALLMIAITLFLRSEAGGNLRENYPNLFLGQRLRDQYLAAQFAGLFATLVGNGVHAVRALALARDAMPSARWRRQLESALRRVREGEKLSVALSGAAAFPDTARRLIEVGEQTGKLAIASREASEIMGETARQRIENIVSLVNPLAIILLGGMVAILVAGVMLGIFALGDFAG